MEKIWATGRRKTASARVRLFAGSGKITVNGKDYTEYFDTEALRLRTSADETDKHHWQL